MTFFDLSSNYIWFTFLLNFYFLKSIKINNATKIDKTKKINAKNTHVK